MPLAAAGVGSSVTLISAIGLGGVDARHGLLSPLEVHQHVPADTGLGTLVKRYLGRYGQWLTGFSMMFLMYALTAAYISGAGELSASSISDWTGISMPQPLACCCSLLLPVAWFVSGHRWSICLTVFCSAPKLFFWW